MIIRSLRLKNIKSYGEGSDGAGITVNFQAGVNRVAGRNGYGKTTLIEALGYTLFFAEPDNDEKFKTSTYFLRAGEKVGEIDVVFGHGGESYRIERDVGQVKRRSKVIQLSDESTCAEGDEAVSAWLCRLLGFKQREQLCALFANLIGVKQGRLTWPFDSKPTASKEFFEPLLDVAVFRESSGFLGDAQGKFKDLLGEQEIKRAGIEVNIRHLADSAEKVPIKEAQVETLEKAVEKSRKQKDEGDKLKLSLEQKQIAFNSARAGVEEAKHALSLARHKRETDEHRVNETQEAKVIAGRAEPGYQAFIKAEQHLRALQERQTEKSALQHQREEASNALTQWQGRKESAGNQGKALGNQREECNKLAEALRQQMAEGAAGMQKLQTECERLCQVASTAKKNRDTFSGWLNSPAKSPEENKNLLRNALVDGELDAVLTAHAEQRRLEEGTGELSRKVIQAEHARSSLANQLTQIGGGVCPFLKQKCRQFDPKSVQSDLKAVEKEHAEVSRRYQESITEHERAKQNFVGTVSTITNRLSENFEREHSNFQKSDRARVARERDLENTNKRLEQIERDSAELTRKLDALSSESKEIESKANAAAARMVELEEKLKAFANLEQDFRAQHEIKDKCGQDHRLFLQNQPLAAKIDSFRDAHKNSREAETRAQEQVQQKTALFELAHKDFDPSALENSRNVVAAANAKLSNDEKDLQSAQRELKQEKERLKQWKEACSERERIEGEIARLKAAGELARLAGKVLKNAAPAVAQHLCTRIAANAQRIFNQISQEPIELEWKAEPQYSLRVIPGERRFAMLSGGEQTKLALAMTLAMIQEFSGLRFAVFDEPTYAVDADSRQKLADAILEAQKAAALEQLIVVSHDDAFEGKIEHVVMLRKDAATGTEAILRE
jgi:exonuclease SbcC